MEIVASRSQSAFRDADFQLTEEDFQILRSRRLNGGMGAWSDPAKPYVMATLAYQLKIIKAPEPTLFHGHVDYRNDPWNLTLNWLDDNYPNWRDESATSKAVAA